MYVYTFTQVHTSQSNFQAKNWASVIKINLLFPFTNSELYLIIYMNLNLTF